MIGAGKDVTSAAADVVIVGGGGAGLTAALVAARLGRRVIVLEKNPVVGGTTAQSVGSITATCTPQQKAAGIDDDPQAHFEDMAAFAGPLANRDNIELRRLFVENVPDTMRFLADLGIEFIGPMPEPPHRQPRMHNILPHARGYTHHLLRHCRREGVIVRTGVRAERLLTDGGRVTGVSATTDTGVVAFRARRAVVLAAGDYSSSEEMKGSLANPTLAAIEGINQASTGDGHRLAVELGAEVVNGDVIWGPEIRFVPPPRPKAIARIPPYRVVAKGVRLAMQYLPDLVLRPFLMSFATTYLAPSQQMFEEGAILVNRAGLRFCDERDQPQWHLPAQPQRVAFVVFDRALAEKFGQWPYFVSTAPGVAYAFLPDYLRNRRDICFSARTSEALAAKAGIDPSGLKRTFVEFGRTLSRPPYYALGPAKSWILLTDGGLRVDTDLRVRGKDGAPMAGLFAAGSTGQGGLLLQGHGHHLGWAFTSGRIAGHSAAIEPRVDVDVGP
jgi:fumarate reductase flavoprotein subunit